MFNYGFDADDYDDYNDDYDDFCAEFDCVEESEALAYEAYVDMQCELRGLSEKMIRAGY